MTYSYGRMLGEESVDGGGLQSALLLRFGKPGGLLGAAHRY